MPNQWSDLVTALMIGQSLSEPVMKATYAAEVE
jgi:hypothetical protein